MRLHDVFDYQARERPTAEFAVHGDRRLSYREALMEVHQLAHALVSAGLQLGDRVAILANNRLESLLLYFAASKVGVVPVPLNYRLAPPEWAYILQDAQAKLLIAAEEYLLAIDGIRGELMCVEHCIAFTEHPPRGWMNYSQWIASQATSAPVCPITDDLEVYQMYTSGTTGHPKGAVLTHRAVTAHLAQATLALGHRAWERLLLVVTLYHAAALRSCRATPAGRCSSGCCASPTGSAINGVSLGPKGEAAAPEEEQMMERDVEDRGCQRFQPQAEAVGSECRPDKLLTGCSIPMRVFLSQGDD